MYYNKLTHSKIKEIILAYDFIIEEFLIEELDSNELERLIGVKTRSSVISICIRSRYDSDVYLVVYESYFEDDYGEFIESGFFGEQSPGKVRRIEKFNKKGNLTIVELEKILKDWLQSLVTIENIKNINSDEEFLSDFEEYSKNVDKKFTQDETFTSIELDAINNKIDIISQEYEKSFKTLMEKEKQNSEKFLELEKELALVNKELSKWKSDAKSMTKRKWFKKFPMSVIKVTRKIPNTVMFLTTALSLGEANPKNIVVGTGLAFISDLTQSEVTSSDIIEQQNKNAPS